MSFIWPISAWPVTGRRLLAALLLTLAPAALAQDDAPTLLAEARSLADTARTVYAGSIFHIDQPLWRQSLNTAERALQLEPSNLEVMAFLAQTYEEIGWHSRAWQYWQAYLHLDGELSDVQAAHFTHVGNELGFSRYQVGDFDGARVYYQIMLEALPESTEALRWLGRIALEQNDPASALPYWQQLAELTPNDPGIAYYVQLTQEQIRVGLDASRAFQLGLRSYETQNFLEALEHFTAATQANDSFAEAFVWAGRTALDLGQPEVALPFWQSALRLEPDDGRARYFIQLSEAQINWGEAAANAFFAGQEAYEQGDIQAAVHQFENAVLMNPEYVDALVWAARSNQELGNTTQAIAYWREVLTLEPGDERARFFLRVAERELAFGGSESGNLLARGITSFQLSQLDDAATFFEAAVAADPDAAEAWGWLARVYFTQARYDEAADAYTRALELEPDNEDYQFFAEEAAFLAERE
jgi:tetratricopeptide (TPR) repeat protein